MTTKYKRYIIIPAKDPSLGQTAGADRGLLSSGEDWRPGCCATDPTSPSGISDHHDQRHQSEEGPRLPHAGATRGGAAFYAKSGKSCFYPGGQSNLVVPTKEVLAWSTDYPRGVLLSGEMISDRGFEMSEQQKERSKPPYGWPEGSPNAKLALKPRRHINDEG
jgi:hypothetical protein